MKELLARTIMLAQTSVFTDDPDGIGQWLESKLRTFGLIMLVVAAGSVGFSILKGQRSGIWRNLTMAIVVFAFLTNLQLLLDAGDLAADLFAKVLKTSSSETTPTGG